jgi:proline iminopeptidase
VSELRTLYPPLEPYATGMLDVGDGQLLYYEQSGNPDGKPAIFLHGGPGGGTSAVHRRLFDPEHYRIVLVDQRGCGKSLPHAADDDVDLTTNTTWYLVEDLEILREQLGIERWLVLGGSWGSTLALAYAETYPERVSELVLRGIFTLRSTELDWYYEGGAGQLFPERYDDFLAQVPGVAPGGRIAAYHRRLFDPDPTVHLPAGVAWTTWETATSWLFEKPDKIEESTQAAHAMAFARIENHYFVHHGFLREGQLVEEAGRLGDIPGVIVQGRYDVVCPPVTAWDLHRAWPGSELFVVPDAGHAFDEPGTLHRLIEATDRFAPR